MLQLVVFMVVLAVVYALKAWAVMRGHDELAAQDAAFSWMSLRPQDEETAAAWAADEQPERVVQRRASLRPARA